MPLLMTNTYFFGGVFAFADKPTLNRGTAVVRTVDGVRECRSGDAPIGTVVGPASADHVWVAIDAVTDGTYTPPAAIRVESNGIRASGSGNPGLSFDGSGMRPAPAAPDECRHCGCPFPEATCHYCGTRTRRGQ